MLQLVFGTYAILTVLSYIWQVRNIERVERLRLWNIERFFVTPIWHIERIMLQQAL